VCSPLTLERRKTLSRSSAWVFNIGPSRTHMFVIANTVRRMKGQLVGPPRLGSAANPALHHQHMEFSAALAQSCQEFSPRARGIERPGSLWSFQHGSGAHSDWSNSAWKCLREERRGLRCQFAVTSRENLGPSRAKISFPPLVGRNRTTPLLPPSTSCRGNPGKSSFQHLPISPRGRLRPLCGPVRAPTARQGMW